MKRLMKYDGYSNGKFYDFSGLKKDILGMMKVRRYEPFDVLLYFNSERMSSNFQILNHIAEDE